MLDLLLKYKPFFGQKQEEVKQIPTDDIKETLAFDLQTLFEDEKAKYPDTTYSPDEIVHLIREYVRVLTQD